MILYLSLIFLLNLMMSSIFSCLVLCLNHILLSLSRRFLMVCPSCCCFSFSHLSEVESLLAVVNIFPNQLSIFPLLLIWRLQPAAFVFAFFLQPCVWCFFDLRCASLLGELSEIQRLWVCIVLSIQNTTYAGEICYMSPDHTATCNEKQSGRVLMKLLYPGFLLRTTEWKREPSYLLP